MLFILKGKIPNAHGFPPLNIVISGLHSFVKIFHHFHYGFSHFVGFYIRICQRKELKGLPEDGYLIKTIVTSNMADAIAEHYNVGLIECLTGFKYIGQQIL